MGSGLFRICFNPSGAADCAGPTGIVILEGKVSIQRQRLWSMAAPTPASPPEQLVIGFSVHTASKRETLSFAGTTRQLPLVTGLAITGGRNPDASLTTCDQTDEPTATAPSAAARCR